MFTQTAPVELDVAENSTGGHIIGDPVGATDPDTGELLTYTLSGDDADSFTVGLRSGRIAVGLVDLNYEAEKNTYTLTLNVSDRKDDDGNADTEVDASIQVNITVTNVVEAAPAPTGVAITALSPMSARVSWNAPDTTDASPIVGYRVLYSTQAGAPYPHASTNVTPLLSGDQHHAHPGRTHRRHDLLLQGHRPKRGVPARPTWARRRRSPLPRHST